jgi:hypothetical protein
LAQGVKTNISDEEIIKAIHNNFGIVTTVCEELGIGKATFYNLANDRIKAELEKARETTTDKVENAFLKNCLQGDRVCQIFYLKTRGRNRGYKEDDVRKDDKLLDLSKLNDKQLKQFENLMQIVEGD